MMTFAFYLFAISACVAGFMVVMSRNPVHSVLWLILAFLSASGLFVLQGAEFVAMLLIVVYVGAVAVLFLFVVMMLDVDFAELKGELARSLPLGLLIGLVLMAQLGMALGQSTFVSLRADHLRVRNPGTVGVDLRTPSLPFLEEMRNAQMVNLSTTDLLEDTPSFDTGTLKTLGAGVNHMFSRRWSGYAKYLYQGSESRSYDTDAAVGSIPYIPRHTAVLGATWVSPQRFYVSGRAVYRSERFEDAENLTRIAPGWGVDLMGYWESQDKHWVVGVAAMNLWAPKSDRRKTRYVLDARYRF